MDFKEQVKKGFLNCKTDIEKLALENDTLKQNISNLERQNQDLKDEVLGVKSLLEKFEKNFLDISNKLESLGEVSKSQEQKVEKNSHISQELYESRREVVKPQVNNDVGGDPYEALLAFKAKANKREMLKQKMISMVSENGLNLAELKFMIVDHFKYCSKATFYNYLKELELERHIRIEREHSKNIVYLSSIPREI